MKQPRRKPLTFLPEQPPETHSADEALPAPQVQRAVQPENLAAKVQTNIAHEEAAEANFYHDMALAARNTIIETH